MALNQSLARLDQLGVNPEDKDIPWNIYSSAVAKSVVEAIAEASNFTFNQDMPHPDLYHPDLDPTDPDWALEISATQHVGKGGEMTAPHQGWLMIVVYKVIEHQTHIIQVEIAHLSRTEWVIHQRGRLAKRSRTAVTIASATERLRENSVYLEMLLANL